VNANPIKATPGVKAGDRIRESAKKLFYRQGIRAVGVDEIVKCARATKPSLYRSFPSKDELAAAYLRDWDSAFWQRFEAAVTAHADDPRAQLRLFLARLTRRMRRAGYRGCALTNAAIEYPEAGHPARRVAVANKRKLRRRLTQMAAAMGAKQPRLLADGLALLLEGAFASSQLFRGDGPARVVAKVADQLIEASLRRRRRRVARARP
jgi:AcrR family transcriptional regulator